MVSCGNGRMDAKLLSRIVIEYTVYTVSSGYLLIKMSSYYTRYTYLDTHTYNVLAIAIIC